MAVGPSWAEFLGWLDRWWLDCCEYVRFRTNHECSNGFRSTGDMIAAAIEHQYRIDAKPIRLLTEAVAPITSPEQVWHSLDETERRLEACIGIVNYVRQTAPDLTEVRTSSPAIADGIASTRLSADVVRGFITIDGNNYQVASSLAELVNELIEADGEFVAANKIVSRPERIMKAAPEEVQDLIDRDNRGYRIRRKWLTNAPT